MDEWFEEEVYSRVHANGRVSLCYENGTTMFSFQKFTKLDRKLHVKDGDRFTINIQKVR